MASIGVQLKNALGAYGKINPRRLVTLCRRNQKKPGRHNNAYLTINTNNLRCVNWQLSCGWAEGQLTNIHLWQAINRYLRGRAT